VFHIECQSRMEWPFSLVLIGTGGYASYSTLKGFNKKENAIHGFQTSEYPFEQLQRLSQHRQDAYKKYIEGIPTNFLMVGTDILVEICRFS
jgi:hypothetical protein